jgi:hypothetical protein
MIAARANMIVKGGVCTAGSRCDELLRTDDDVLLF